MPRKKSKNSPHKTFIRLLCDILLTPEGETPDSSIFTRITDLLSNPGNIPKGTDSVRSILISCTPETLVHLPESLLRSLLQAPIPEEIVKINRRVSDSMRPSLLGSRSEVMEKLVLSTLTDAQRRRREREIEREEKEALLSVHFETFALAASAISEDPSHPLMVQAIDDLSEWLCDRVFLHQGYALETIDSGYDLSTKAVPTGEPIDVSQYEFVGDLLTSELSGHTEATYQSGYGLSATSLDLDFDYQKLLSEIVARFVSATCPSMIQDGRYLYDGFFDHLCDQAIDYRIADLFSKLPLRETLRESARFYVSMPQTPINHELATELFVEWEAMQLRACSAAPQGDSLNKRRL